MSKIDNNSITTAGDDNITKEKKETAFTPVEPQEETESTCKHSSYLVHEKTLYAHKFTPIYLVRCIKCGTKWVLTCNHTDISDENMIHEGECDHSNGLVEKVEDGKIWAVCPDCDKHYPVCDAPDPANIDSVIDTINHACARGINITEHVEHVDDEDVFADGVMDYTIPKMNVSGTIATIMQGVVFAVSAFAVPYFITWVMMAFFCIVFIPSWPAFLISAIIHFAMFVFINKHIYKK